MPIQRRETGRINLQCASLKSSYNAARRIQSRLVTYPWTSLLRPLIVILNSRSFFPSFILPTVGESIYPNLLDALPPSFLSSPIGPCLLTVCPLFHHPRSPLHLDGSLLFPLRSPTAIFGRMEGLHGTGPPSGWQHSTILSSCPRGPTRFPLHTSVPKRDVVRLPQYGVRRRWFALASSRNWPCASRRSPPRLFRAQVQRLRLGGPQCIWVSIQLIPGSTMCASTAAIRASWVIFSAAIISRTSRILHHPSAHTSPGFCSIHNPAPNMGASPTSPAAFTLCNNVPWPQIISLYGHSDRRPCWLSSSTAKIGATGPGPKIQQLGAATYLIGTSSIPSPTTHTMQLRCPLLCGII